MLAGLLGTLLLAGAADSPLASLLPAKEALPACAKLFVPPAGAAADGPCGSSGNPYASRDPKFVTCFAQVVLDIGKVPGVKADEASEAALATYQSRAEMGLLAVAFKTPQAAKAVAASLERALAGEAAEGKRGEPRTAVVTRGNSVGFAACDSMFDDACCQQMLGLVKDLWGKP